MYILSDRYISYHTCVYTQTTHIHIHAYMHTHNDNITTKDHITPYGVTQDPITETSTRVFVFYVPCVSPRFKYPYCSKLALT